MRQAMKAGFGLTALAAVTFFTGAPYATGQEVVCAPRDQLVSQLDIQFNEQRRAMGLMGQRTIMEVFASQGGTWTILSTNTAGISCIVAAGKGWDESFAFQVGEGV